MQVVLSYRIKNGYFIKFIAALYNAMQVFVLHFLIAIFELVLDAREHLLLTSDVYLHIHFLLFFPYCILAIGHF